MNHAERARDAGASDDLLVVDGLCKYFPVVRGVFGKEVGQVRAVDDVSFTIRRGETLGLVGESGCGKTTAGRSILRLIEPSAGRVFFDGTDLTGLEGEALRRFRRRMQIVFQDPFSSLNPRMRVMDIVGEAIERHGIASGAAVEREVRSLLGRVGLPENWASRYPHEFSGGQRQRIGVARAIAVGPELVVCDEAVSALDVSIQAQVINLLIDLRREMGLAYLFIAHDLSVVRHVSERVAVMYLGKIVELSPARELFRKPAHPYTRALLSAIPVADPRRRVQRVVLHGDVPSPQAPPPGCHFHTRCPAALDRCREEAPAVTLLEGGRRQVRCVHAEGLADTPDWYPVLEARLQKARRESLEGRASVSAPPAEEPVGAAESSRSSSAPPAAAAWLDEDGPSAPPLASGALALVAFLTTAVGLGLSLFGSWALGGALVVAGYAGLRLAPAASSRPPQPRQLTYATACLWLTAVVASRWVVPVRQVAIAQSELSVLRDEVEAHRANVGEVPPSLAAIRWRTADRFGSGEPRDPWGRRYRYAPADDLRTFDLSSVGRDGVVSDDDVQLP